MSVISYTKSRILTSQPTCSIGNTSTTIVASPTTSFILGSWYTRRFSCNPESIPSEISTTMIQRAARLTAEITKGVPLVSTFTTTCHTIKSTSGSTKTTSQCCCTTPSITSTCKVSSLARSLIRCLFYTRLTKTMPT